MEISIFYIAALALTLLPFAANAGANAVACVPSDPANESLLGWAGKSPHHAPTL
jgi:hypothetical protein